MEIMSGRWIGDQRKGDELQRITKCKEMKVRPSARQRLAHDYLLMG